MTRPGTDSKTGIEVRHMVISDPAASPLRAGLLDEYVARYGPGAVEEMNCHRDELFTPEGGGAFLLLTAELKRIWTHADHRRRGLARRVLAELEATARSRGYGYVQEHGADDGTGGTQPVRKRPRLQKQLRCRRPTASPGGRGPAHCLSTESAMPW
jgi:GNAT superfamily N-acetyltransferase